MTVKLLLLKSGEDVISDVSEMNVGTEENPRIVGYYLNRPCIVKMRNPKVEETEDKSKFAGFEVSLFPWMPLSKETKIPVSADWVITMVEPVDKLNTMYTKEVIDNGKDNQSNPTDEQSDSDQSD